MKKAPFVCLILVMVSIVQAKIFDSIVSFRQGTNALDEDTASWQNVQEPNVPDSVEKSFAYTSSHLTDGKEIEIVHCYSMRNGQFGQRTEARVFWSRISFSDKDYLRDGQAENVQAIAIPIETQIEQFDVYESDLTAFLMAQTRLTQIILHVVPGPSVSATRKMRTFTFFPVVKIPFTVSELVVLTQSNKAIFYSNKHLGEIDLQLYPFQSDDDEVPTIKIHKVHNLKSEEVGANPDTSAASELMDLQPLFNDQKWTGQVALLMTNVEVASTTLRIDTIDASNVLGSAVNIARINTEAEAAFNAARFAEIHFSEDDLTKTKTHFFVTLAYQSYPYHANFLSISEARQTSQGAWDLDRSQSFQITKEDLKGIYLNILGIRKNLVSRSDGTNDITIDFTVFMAADDRLYRAEFAVVQYDGQQPNEFAISKAEFHKSLKLNINEALSRVAFQRSYHNVPSHQWPEFYLFVTSTRQLSAEEIQATGQSKRMTDGLLLSEHYLRKPKPGQDIELIREREDFVQAFTLSGNLVEGVTYSDSRILPLNSDRVAGKTRTTVFDATMRNDDQHFEMQIKDTFSFGNTWTANTEECALVDIDYRKLPSIGITESELVSYMDVMESSRSNIFENQMLLVDNQKHQALKLYNNADQFVEQLIEDRCSEDDIFCQATTSLCFVESSKLSLCDKNEFDSDRLYEPTTDKVFEQLPLVGQVFYMSKRKNDQCYISGTMLDRLDGKSCLADNYVNSQRIVVADPGQQPYLDIDPPLKWYMGAGQAFEIPFSSVTDPEDNYVFFLMNFRQAARFARYDYDQRKILVDKRATNLEEDAGEYPITISLIERINRAQMRPARKYELVLKVGEVIPEEPLPALKAAPDGIKLPKMEVNQFTPLGLLKITISKPLEFPQDLRQRFNKIKKTSVPLYGESEEIGYIRNMMKIELVYGNGNDIDMLGFEYEITAIESTQIDVQISFENPVAISQGVQPDQLQITVNLEKYTDPDGLSIGRNYTMTTLIPRQLPDADTLSSVNSAAIFLVVMGTLIIIGHIVGCIFYKISINQLWFTIYGLQLAVHMPLYFTRFPANANNFLQILIDWTSLEIFPRSATDSFFDLPVRESYNVNLQASRYESLYLVANARMCHFLVILYAVQCVAWLILNRLKEKSKCAKIVYEKYSTLLFCPVLIRLILFMYLELAVSCFVNLATMEFTAHDFSAIFSNVITLIIALLIIGLPAFIWTFFGCQIRELGYPDFDCKYGEFYSGLKFDKTPAKRYKMLFYPFWFVMRRLLFAFTVVVAQDVLMVQYYFAFGCSLVNLCYLLVFQPFTDRMVYLVEIFNESTNLILLYHTVCFSNMVLDDLDRYKLGWSFIAFFCLSFTLLMGMLVYTILSTIYRTWRSKKILKIKIESGQLEREQRLRDKMQRELSMIREDDFESNHSEKDSDERRKQDQLSESDWDSRLGHTEKGYDMKAIQWNDLGRKYIFKKGKKSVLADIDVSMVDGAGRMAAGGQFHTLDDRFIDVNIKLKLDLNKDIGGKNLERHSLSASKLHKRNASVDHNKKFVLQQQKEAAENRLHPRLISSKESSADQAKSQLIVYQNISEKEDELQPVIESQRSIVEETARQKLIMIDTCLNVNKIAPTGNPIKRYGSTEEDEQNAGDDRHETIDVPENGVQTSEHQKQKPVEIFEEELQEYEKKQNSEKQGDQKDQPGGGPLLTQEDEEIMDGLLQEQAAEAKQHVDAADADFKSEKAGEVTLQE